MDCPPKFGDGAFSVQLVTQRVCAKEQEGGGSEGVRQWHREEAELGTVSSGGHRESANRGFTGQGSPSERSKPISEINYVIK